MNDVGPVGSALSRRDRKIDASTIITCVVEFQVSDAECVCVKLIIYCVLIVESADNYALCQFTGKQAVLVLSCDNSHMGEDVMVEPGLVMIFAHGIE